ncbi:hypothetical protein GCM10023175_54760 [Pseudonocardia xishanensis]|uniref:Uncharacterized protein n=1 Tax=Pseudonocardia xishanensis TaxID=630995 RepID=A0ABP8RYY1_9PSEU
MAAKPESPSPMAVRSRSRRSHSGVRTTPGEKALTVMPCSATARAAAWVSEMTAALLALYGAKFG